MLVSRDGGAHWAHRAAGTNALLFAVTCPMIDDCLIVGTQIDAVTGFPVSIISVSTDGGMTWRVRAGKVHGLLDGIACPTPRACLAVGDSGSILASNDGGLTWTTRTALANDPLMAVNCLSQSVCVAVGAWIHVSIDGGLTWHTRYSVPMSGYWVNLTCIGSGTCVAVGQSGVILRTSDSGSTGGWPPLATEPDLTRLLACKAASAWQSAKI